MMRRLFAILLALLILVGNIPAQAFAEVDVPQETAACATDGCSYGAGHEGNCSNYVEPCSTEGCEYPAGHEGNCSNYVEPCSTEGCEYPAGHEGNCSNYVEPCSTEGCEYPAGHDGNCSNFVQQPDPDVAAAREVIALIDAIGQVTLESEAAIAAADRAYGALTAPQKALVTNADVLTAAKNAYMQLSAQPDPADGNPADPAKVTVTISDHGVLALVQAEITVTDLDEDGLLSFDEAMVITHEQYCPDGYATVPHPDYNLTVTKFWNSGSEGGTANILTFTNNVCNQLNLGETYIQEGDRLYGAVLKDDYGFDDWYAYFTEQEREVDAGEPFELTLMGYYGMAFGEVTSVPTPGVDIGTWADGEFASLNTTTDEDGKVNLCFDTPGTYVVSADGVVPYDPYGYGAIDCPLIPPACVVTVNAVQTEAAVERVTLNQTSAQLTVGDTLTLEPTILPGNAANQNVSWYTTNPNIASVEFGKVTAVAKGTATITVTTEDGGKTAQCEVTVNNPAVSAVTVNPTSLTITQGDAPVQLTATITPANAEVNEITWSSNNLSVATVDDNGVVTAGIDTGDTVITVTAGGKSADCTVTVLEAPAASGGISIKTGDESGGMGEHFLSKIVLVGLGGTVSPREENTWKIELSSDTDIKQPITFEMTSALFSNVSKNGFYFYANGVPSEVSVQEADPGTVTITPEWSEGKATVALGVKKEAAKTFSRTYTLQLSVAGITQNALPVLTDPENRGAEAKIMVGETYTLNLAPLFIDKDEDKLTYTVQIGDASPVPADADYRWQPSQPGKYTLIFRANDGKGNSEECYTVELEVAENTAPSINNGDKQITDQAKQYYPWTIDLSQVFTDAQGGELTYTVAVNGADPAAAAASYCYTPESTLDQTLVFRAADPSGAVSEPYTVTLKVEPVPRTIFVTSCTGSDSGDTWVEKIEVIGVEVQSSIWNVTANHEETEPHILRVELDQETPADAVVTLSYTLAGTTELMGTVSGPDSVTLQDGKATATVTSTGWMGSAGTERTYVLNFTREPNAVPTATPARDTVELTVGEAYSVDLTEIFSAGDSDPLTYRLSIDGVDEGAVETDYSRTITSAGTYEFVFSAEDPWGAAATYTVTITAAIPVVTFDARFLVPEGITPAFYATKSFNGEAGDTYDGDALTATAGEAEAGFVPYTVKVPEKVKRVSFRGTDGNGTEWGGMTAAVKAQGETVVLAQVAALIPSKVDGSFATADQVKFQLKDMDGHYLVSGGTHTDTYGAVCYRFLVHAMGTEDLVKAYTAYAVPAKALESRYTTTVGNNITFPTAEPRQELQLNMTLISTLSITAPKGAEVRVFQQQQYYNSPEIHVEETIENEDDTTTWVFEKGNNAFTTYRVSMEGKITKAGYVAADEIEVSWSDDDPAPNCRDPYDPSTLYGSRGDDSVVLNVNGRNHLVLNQGESFRLRAYRIWEIINNDSSNIIIQPDMHWSAAGDDILTLAPVESGNGNGVNNWMDITAKDSGVAFLEVSYDALQIATGNASNFGGEEIDGFTFRACDSARTGLVVVQVGNAATDVNFGIHCSSVQNNSNVAWDAEFDTLYFTGSSGELSLTPSVSSGEIDKVEVSGNKGASWMELMAAEGSYTANIGSGNHVIRITKTDGTEAYQVVRGDRVSVTITQTKDGGDGDTVVEPGETFRVQLHGIHNPIGKMSGNYNPGFQQGQHLNYRFNGQNVSTSSHYQYNFVSNAWVNVTIPREAEPGESFALTGGYISFNLIGIGDVTSDTGNHRGIGDDGCMTRGSGGSQHQRSLLPEITLTVGRNTDGSDPTVAVESVTLNETAKTMVPGETLTLTATVLPANATERTVTWSSENTSVAVVDNGVVTARAAGTTRITAAAGGVTAVCTITVEVPVTAVSLNRTTASMEVGDTLTLTATVTPENATDADITWTSSNDTVASVSASGTVTANAAGTAEITAAAGGKTAKCTITVTAPEEEDPGQEDGLGSVTISFEDRVARRESELSGLDAIYRSPLGSIVAGTRVEIEPYDTIADVTLRLLDQRGMTYEITGDTKNAFYLAAIGNFTANGTRYASFGEFDGGVDSGWMITLNGVFIGRGASSFKVEDGDVIRWQYTCQLGTDIGGGGATGGGTGGSTGGGTEDDDDSAVAVTGVVLNKTSLSLKVNGTETLTATVKPDGATDSQVSWTSDDITVATVDANGKVTGKKAGTARITATAGGKYATCTVTVTSSSTTTTTTTTTTTGGKTTTTTSATTVASLIRALPTAINKTHEKQVLAALDAYNALSDAQKKVLDASLVTKLEDAKQKLAKVMTTAQEQSAAAEVEKQIDALGEVTLESENTIVALRAAYDKLSKYQQFLVGNGDKLTAAEKKLAALKAANDPMYVYETTGNYLSKLGTPGVGSVGGEWMVIGLARSGREVPTGYYDHVVEYVGKHINEAEQLHKSKSSDNSRVILGLTAIGKDVTNVDGHNLLLGLTSMDYVQKQGINGPIWALLAFDCGNYPVPEGDVSREKLVEVILKAQLPDGGWVLSGEKSDPDMTGMAIQALAPYMTTNPAVKSAVEKAVTTLSKLQNEDGTFSSVDGANCESAAQVITALAALGIDADTDARFVKNGNSALDALLRYFIPGGGFGHTDQEKVDGMATEQGYYALTAYYRMKQNQSFLFNMTDVVDRGGDAVPEETTQPTEPPTEEQTEEKRGNGVLIWSGVMSLCAGAIALILANRKKIFGKFL